MFLSNYQTCHSSHTACCQYGSYQHVFLFTDKQRDIKGTVELRVDIKKLFVGRFGPEILECFRSFFGTTQNGQGTASTVSGSGPCSLTMQCVPQTDNFSLYRVSQEERTNFGRVFLMLNYTDITQNTYIQS